MSEEDKAGAEVEAEVEEAIEIDDRPIKQIIKESAKAYLVKKGRQAFFAAVMNNKAQAKEQGKKAKPIPTKKASTLRVGDITERGELRSIQKSPVDKKMIELTFIGDKGVVREIVPMGESYKVIERRSIKQS